MALITDTLEILKTKYKIDIESIKIENVRIGVYETIVALSGGLYGIASTFSDNTMNYDRNKLNTIPFLPGKIKGQYIKDLLPLKSGPKILNSLKVAVLNALSAKIIKQSGFMYYEKMDPFDLLDLSERRTITIVGAFRNYIEKVVEGGHQLYILELNRELIGDAFQQYFIPTTCASEVLPRSDIVIMTGSTIVNGSFESLVEHISEHCLLALAGPSCSFTPEVLFQNKVKLIGSTVLTNPSEAMQLVSEAASGFHLFKSCAEKICMVNESLKEL